MPDTVPHLHANGILAASVSTDCSKTLKMEETLMGSFSGDYWKCWLGLHLINEAALLVTLQCA